MQIQSGKLYENRTWKYLYPCLRSYGTTLKSYLNTLYKLGVGIGDHNLDIEENACIYILIDTSISTPQMSLANYRENIAKFLDWVRFQDYYVIDYIFGGLDSGEKHMLVLKIPEGYNKAYQRFIKGRYSEMYTTEEIDEIFSLVTLENKDLEIKMNGRTRGIKAVLNRESNYVPTFRKQILDEFDVDCTLEELQDHELDFPPNMGEEMFNYNKELVT